jgi:uncharacterized UPF0160 family protein
MSPAALPLLVTHGGKFHCDEVVAYAVLRAALGLREPGVDHRLSRTRDAQVIAAGDIVWDVGFVHDAATSRFDHHQRGAPLRADGTPFSSAGLVWQVYGVRAVQALLRPGAAEPLAEAVAAELDATVMRRIDALDNGVAGTHDDLLGLASLIGDCNPPWDAAGDPAAADAAFLHAAELAAGVLLRRIDMLRARLAAEAIVVAAHAASADPRILELERGMPWKAAVFSHALPVLYAVYPAGNGRWMVDAMPPEPGSFEQRLPLPETWAGLQDAALVQACGVADAVFVHLRRFVAAANSRAGALEMARRAVEGENASPRK